MGSEKVDKSDYDSFKNLFRAGPKIFIPNMDEKVCFHGAIISSIFDPKRNIGGDKFSLDFLENAIVETGQGVEE